MRALTVRQPWAWLLFHGKDVENRNWSTSYRGPLAIHAASGMTWAEYRDAVDFVARFNPELARRIPQTHELVCGAVIGKVLQVACAREWPSPWFQGKFGHIYDSPVLFPEPVAAKGRLGFWEWEPRHCFTVTDSTGREHAYESPEVTCKFRIASNGSLRDVVDMGGNPVDIRRAK